MHYQNRCTSCDIMMKLTCFVITIQFAEDKCRKLTLFKNQVLNYLEQKEIILHQFNCKVGKNYVYVFLSFYMYSLAVKDDCSLLTVEWKAFDSRNMHVNYNPF